MRRFPLLLLLIFCLSAMLCLLLLLPGKTEDAAGRMRHRLPHPPGQTRTVSIWMGYPCPEKLRSYSVITFPCA